MSEMALIGGNDERSNREVMELIDDHASTVLRAMKEALGLVKEQLVNAAIECELPSDLNELDLAYMIENPCSIEEMPTA